MINGILLYLYAVTISSIILVDCWTSLLCFALRTETATRNLLSDAIIFMLKCTTRTHLVPFVSKFFLELHMDVARGLSWQNSPCGKYYVDANCVCCFFYFCLSRNFFVEKLFEIFTESWMKLLPNFLTNNH